MVATGLSHPKASGIKPVKAVVATGLIKEGVKEGVKDPMER